MVNVELGFLRDLRESAILAAISSAGDHRLTEFPSDHGLIVSRPSFSAHAEKRQKVG